MKARIAVIVDKEGKKKTSNKRLRLRMRMRKSENNADYSLSFKRSKLFIRLLDYKRS